MKSWLCAALAVLVAVVGREASAAITIQDGIPWVYEGMGSGGVSILHGPGCGDVTIPAELDCYPVRGISSSAFANCTGLTSVTLPNNVTSIGWYAFSGCTGLKTLCVPLSMAGTSDVGNSGVPSSCAVLYGDAWEEVEGQAWSYVVEGGKAIVMAGPRQGNVVIPSVLGGHPVTGIGSNAFRNCSSLTSVTIPDSVTSIGYSAFYNCSGLPNLTIPDSVTNIGEYAFSSCNGLTAVNIHDLKAWCEIDFGDYWSANPLYYAKHLYWDGEEVAGDLVIPNGTKAIGRGAFYCCTNLISVTIPDSVTSIGRNAFFDCNGLTAVTIPDSVTSIGEYAFSGCSGLTAVNIHDVKAWCEIDFAEYSANPLCYAKHLYLDGEEVAGDLAIPDGTKTIGISAFYYCTNLTSVVIPDSVTSIGYDAFYNCSGMTNVDIGNGVTNIENYAFSGCRDLMAVDIGNGVTSINATMFTNCNSLAMLTIGNGVTNVGAYAFYKCTNLTSVTIGTAVTSIGYNAFTDGDNLTAVTIHDLKAWCEIDFANSGANPLNYAGHLYLDGEEVAGALVIPDGTKSIGIGAFYYCTNLTSVAIPNSVTNIGSGAFEYCCGLESVTIPDSVTNIGNGAFYWCTGLTLAVIGDGVTDIGNLAFYNCTNLLTVTIPVSVTGIGEHTFTYCRGLKTLYAPASWESKYVNGTFWSIHADVPSECEIIYYNPEAPAATTTGVPHSWLAGYGLGDGTAEGYEAAANARAANGRKVWECYVLGLDPREEDKDFTVAISFPDGPSEPKIEWAPDLNEGGTKEERVYEVEGVSGMTNNWGATNAASRFFRVKVGLP